MYISLCGQRPYPQYGGSGGGGDHIAHMYVLYIYNYIYMKNDTSNHQRVSDLGQKTSGQQKTAGIYRN